MNADDVLFSLQRMADAGVTQVVECGPGKVLTGMTKRIDARLAGTCIVDPASLAATLETAR